MTFLQNLRASIISILDLYLNHGKRFFSLSLLYAILSGLAALLVGFIFALISALLDGHGFGKTHEVVSDIAYIMSYNPDVGAFTESISVLLLVFLAIFMLRETQRGYPAGSITLGRMFRDSHSRIISQLVITSVCFIALYLLMFFAFNLMDDFQREDGLLGLRTFGGGRMHGILGYFSRIANLILAYLPYFLVAFFLFKELDPERSWKKYIKAFVVVLLLSLFMQAISEKCGHLLQFYILDLLSMPFAYSILPAVLAFFVTILVAAFFLPAVVGAITFPILHQFNSDPPPQQTHHLNQDAYNM